MKTEKQENKGLNKIQIKRRNKESWEKKKFMGSEKKKRKNESPMKYQQKKKLLKFEKK